MFNKLKIKLLQDRVVQTCSLRANIEASIEELKELAEELEMFLYICGNDVITTLDLNRVCGNMQKEIEDVSAITEKLRLMFIRTFRQRMESRKAKRKIVKQLKKVLRDKGLI
jgi:hypothetical protein